MSKFQKIILSMLLMVVLLTVSGCEEAATYYGVGINAFVDSNYVLHNGSLKKTDPILIYVSQESKTFLADVEVSEKLNKWLLKCGYLTTVNMSDAKYVMMFDYATDGGKNEPYSAYNENTGAYDSINNMVYKMEFKLYLYDKNSVLSSLNYPKKITPVYQVDATSRRNNNNIREVVDAFIIAATKYLGTRASQNEDVDTKSLDIIYLDSVQ